MNCTLTARPLSLAGKWTEWPSQSFRETRTGVKEGHSSFLPPASKKETCWLTSTSQSVGRGHNHKGGHLFDGLKDDRRRGYRERAPGFRNDSLIRAEWEVEVISRLYNRRFLEGAFFQTKLRFYSLFCLAMLLDMWCTHLCVALTHRWTDDSPYQHWHLGILGHEACGYKADKTWVRTWCDLPNAQEIFFIFIIRPTKESNLFLTPNHQKLPHVHPPLCILLMSLSSSQKLCCICSLVTYRDMAMMFWCME